MAWEEQRRRSLLPQISTTQIPLLTIGLPHTGMTSMYWANCFDSLDKPRPYIKIPMAGQPIDIARNLIVKQFLTTGSPWLLFLDSDIVLGTVNQEGKVVPDNTAITRMLSRNKTILTGIYYRRSDPPVPGIYKYFPDLKPAPGHRPIMEYPMNQLFECDAVGAGCLLVHREIFLKVPRPWFKFGEIDANEMSEDFYMIHKCVKYGFSTWVDPSVQCKHLLLLAVSRSGITTVDA